MLIPGPSDVLRRILGFFRGPAHQRSERKPGVAHQVAALPVKVTRSGTLKVLLISTRGSSGKLIVPRGWPMKGKADFQAAAIEAEEEAGVLGPIDLHPIGSYEYRSGRKAAGEPIRVDVYRLDVKRRAARFKEKGARRLVWLSVQEAARQVGDRGLSEIIAGLAPGKRPVA